MMNRRIRHNRKNSLRRERIVMITSSAFVLAALTMTGVYFNGQNTENKDDGYTIDFTELEQAAPEKTGELALKAAKENSSNHSADSMDALPGNAGREEAPQKAGEKEVIQKTGGEEVPENAMDGTEKQAPIEENAEVSSAKVQVARTLQFSEEEGLLRPVEGDILMNYSMDGSVYFATLDQYKYNPATIFAAEEGEQVSACARGKVQSIYANEELGQIVVLELGDGYLATYGQLKDLKVSEGDYVSTGDVIGSVSAPSKYYSVEGSNLYFQLARDGVTLNAEELFQ